MAFWTFKSLGSALLVVAGFSSGVHASPVIACKAADGRLYGSIEQHLRGASTYLIYGTRAEDDQFVLAHCKSKSQVRVQRDKNSPHLQAARSVVIRMIADTKDQTFSEVVEQLERMKFRAAMEPVVKDGCICAGES